MKIAITGGIGSGKSFVGTRLLTRGIKVYDCDEAAKRLLRTSTPLREALIDLVGDDVYDNGHALQKRVLAQFILENERNRHAVNDIVHPAVARDFEQSGLDWLESAILFDSGFNLRTHLDWVICVTAPLEIRVGRVMMRDNISGDEAMRWVNSQMPQDEMLAQSDFQVVADGDNDIDGQLDLIINKTQYKKQ